MTRGDDTAVCQQTGWGISPMGARPHAVYIFTPSSMPRFMPSRGVWSCYGVWLRPSKWLHGQAANVEHRSRSRTRFRAESRVSCAVRKKSRLPARRARLFTSVCRKVVALRILLLSIGRSSWLVQPCFALSLPPQNLLMGACRVGSRVVPANYIHIYIYIYIYI